MEPEQRGRRASSTSSLGREVRCGCQYYQSDSLLPERRALQARPSSRTMQQPPAVRCSEHEYEPIASPSPHPAMAPVVRITDTDVMPVADSDDSIDDRGRLPPELILDGDLILPLDGKIEDSAMEGRELGGTGDTSEEQEPTTQQFQDRLEERFLDAPTPYTESRTDGEVNTSQVDSAMEELPLRRGAHGLSQRMKTQASKLRSRLRDFKRPTFSFPQKRQKPDKKKTTTTTTTRSTASSGKSEKSRKSAEKRPSRMDRIRMSISEKTAKLSLPDRSKFHLPERPKFSFPDKSRFHLPERPKFNIKKPNIRLPEAFTRVKRPSLHEQQQHSTESTAGSKRNIFDFATYPRIFDKKSKKHDEYATSSPKDSRTQSAESATFPRIRNRKSFGARWTQRFSTYNPDQDRPEEEAAASDSPPWHQSSIEEPPRLSARTEEEILAAARAIPWEDTRKRDQYDEEEIQYMDHEQESSEMSDRHSAPPKRMHKMSGRQEESYEQEEVMDPRLYDQEIKPVHGDEVEEDEDAPADWRANQEMMLEEKFRPIARARSLDEDIPRVMGREEYDETFIAVNPRRFGPHTMTPEEEKEGEEELEEDEEEHEPSSMQSDREQQPSSGSSYDRRRRGVIEEIDSDEFFVRASGISQDDINLNNYLTDEIREALKSKIDELPPTPPPQRPMRTLKKRKEDLTEQSTEAIPPARPKRERSAAARRSREASIVDEVFRERTRSDSRSDSRHLVVYQTEGNQSELLQEPLDDIVVVKPARRKSRSSLRSQSQPPMESSILFPSMPAVFDSSDLLSATPPIVPVRRKRSHRETMMDRRNGNVNVPICNGHRDDEWEIEIAKKPVIPTRKSRSRQSLVERDILMSTSRDNIINLDARHRRAESAPEPEVVPVPPKRRSRSRTTSVAADEDRTSHGAESLPEADYIEEDIPREDESGSRDFFGYAIVEKREKPPRPPPPRKKRNKFATTPRPTPPKRPQRAYSTLGPARTRDTSAASEIGILTPTESTPYIEIDAEDIEHRDLRSGMLNKIQGRPLPAPPRPPRAKKEHAIIERPRTPFEYSETMETTAATQTDPLPDDMVIEEITQAKLIVTPSISGSQVMVSMERIPSPSRTSTPPVPPLPMSQFIRKEEEEEEEEEERQEEDIRMAYGDTVSLRTPSPMRERDLEDKYRSAPHLKERVAKESQSRPQIKSSGLLSDEPLRISTLEVGDLKVDRLSVSQIEAHKIMASEVDAMMITASELRGDSSSVGESFSPAIIRELMAIRSHLETVVQERHRESEESASRKIPDIPTTDDSQVREQESVLQEDSREAAESDEAIEPVFAEDKETETNEDQKVVKTDIIDVKDKKILHALSVAQTKEFPSSQILAIDELESKGKDELITHLLKIAQGIQDKSLRILDSEHPLTLSSQTTSGSHVDESRASYPPLDVPSARPSESRVSPERVDELPSSSVQSTTITSTTSTATATATATSTSTTTTIAADPGTTSTSLHGSKDDLSDSKEQIPRKSRSRSPSPSKGIVRQTASPVRSLPPAISVTPDTPDSIVQRHGTSVDAQPQRAIISYSSDTRHSVPKDAKSQRAVISHSSDTRQSLRERQRESSESPVSSFPLNSTHLIAFPASEIPIQFFSLSEINRHIDIEPGVIDTTQQLLRAIRSAGIRAMRHFIRYLTSTLSVDDTREKIREVELAICALLLLIVGLLIYYFSNTKTVTHLHHWDYFNPPQ
ncbi:hypothetical protein CAJAP_06655 [Camponotus japonicus]